MKIVEEDSWKRSVSLDKDYDYFTKHRKIIRDIALNHNLRFRWFCSFEKKLKQGNSVFIDEAVINFTDNQFKIFVHYDMVIYDTPRFKRSILGFAKDLELRTKRKVNVIFSNI
jgi:hypothetical protein